MIEISFANTDQLVIRAIESKAEIVGARVASKMNELDAETVAYIVSAELHGQILKQRTGKLAGSVRAIPPRQEGTSIISQVEAAGGPAWYGALFEKGGTGPFDIVPVAAKALKFIGSDGNVVFAKRVHHPGIPSKPFMAPALEARTPAILAGIEEAIGEVLSS